MKLVSIQYAQLKSDRILLRWQIGIYFNNTCSIIISQLKIDSIKILTGLSFGCFDFLLKHNILLPIFQATIIKWVCD
jgi:uncharacterized membrane protein YagU involved in acid resistance